MFPPWWYYSFMVIDPLLRANWIILVGHQNNLPHWAILTYVVGLLEVVRRALWIVVRIEKEHCRMHFGSAAYKDFEGPVMTVNDEEQVLGADNATTMDKDKSDKGVLTLAGVSENIEEDVGLTRFPGRCTTW